MKTLHQQWSNLFSRDHDDQLLTGFNGTLNLDAGADLFDAAAEVVFANRFPSFNPVDIDVQEEINCFNDPNLVNNELVKEAKLKERSTERQTDNQQELKPKMVMNNNSPVVIQNTTTDVPHITQNDIFIKKYNEIIKKSAGK